VSTLNCQSCRKLTAALADMRIRLQKAHGALSVFRDPQTGGKPVSEWTWNQDALRDIRALYEDLPKLLEATRPDAASGVEILDELRRTREALEIAVSVLTWYASRENYQEACDVCAGEPINKDTVEESWIPDGGDRARTALTKITGKEFPPW
jgi:hypothetical protein